MLDSLLASVGGAGLPTDDSWEHLETKFIRKEGNSMWASPAQQKFVNKIESMDFEDQESIVWRKHHLRRFFQDRGALWSVSRGSTLWKWILTILIGVLIALMGLFVRFTTTVLTDAKFDAMNKYYPEHPGVSFTVFVLISLAYSLTAGALCTLEPAAAGSGIPEIKAYLNGLNLNKLVRVRVLFAKLVGMCFSCASGLPLGKEGPMIHAGSVVGAAVSQGKTITFGIDTSWTKFQDLRNDRHKRDFVTFGAAAGVAAAFSAPIGGVLFTLEEGASFWSTSLTFRAFFCAMITELTINLLTSGVAKSRSILGIDQPASMFDFGTFNTFGGYHTYELLIFITMGAMGGILGAFFNHCSRRITIFRRDYINHSAFRRVVELSCVTVLFAALSFSLPLMSTFSCTQRPIQIAQWTSQEQKLLSKLVTFNCPSGQYSQLASLYLVDADTALQQLFHFTGSTIAGTSDQAETTVTFSTGSLFLFFVPYFFFAIVTGGTLCPAGLFVPTLISGATLGRIIGHILKVLFSSSVTDSGTYALIGAAAMLGGVSRMTIAGAVIMLEACGNSEYLLPLMLAFASARYSGNAINMAIYDLQIRIQGLPFLEGQLRSLGLLNYHPVIEVMAKPVRTVFEVNRVASIYELLSQTAHNGFPVVSATGQLRGLVLRKTLCSLLKLKGFAASRGEEQARFFYDTLERNYPHYPKIEDIKLSPKEMESGWLDVREYMDTAPYSLNESSSIARCYRLFRTMGLRHLVVLDDQHRVTGIVTRKDITEEQMEQHWRFEGEAVQQFLTADERGGGGYFDVERVRDFESAAVPLDALQLPVSGLTSYTAPTQVIGAGAMGVSRKESVSSQVGYEFPPSPVEQPSVTSSAGQNPWGSASSSSSSSRRKGKDEDEPRGNLWTR